MTFYLPDTSSIVLNWQSLAANSVVCLIAPTASGKTDLAFELYNTGRFELISVDSALIYQDMDIGTAKPSKDELSAYPHHLVDIITPAQCYNVATFVQDVQRLIELCHANHKIPLLVGGTMMYYMALFDGISAVPQTNENVRRDVANWHKTKGNEAIYEYLLKYDPAICQKLTVFDTQRIIRAVEVHKQTGIPISVWQASPKIALSHGFNWQWYGLCVMPDRAWLHNNIAVRLDKMWQAGLVEEVIDIITHYPVTADMPSMRCVGYRQVIDYLINTNHHCLKNTQIQASRSSKPLDYSINACQEMKNKALYATRQLAKRQYTWLRSLSVINKPTLNAPSNNNDIPAHRVKMVTFTSIEQVKQRLLYNN